MSTPWTATRTLTPAQVAAHVAAAAPDLAGLPVTPYGEGWDNAAFLVGARWVFRFPRRPLAVPLLEVESRWLPVLAPHLPLAVPAPAYTGVADGWPFAGYRELEGTTACRAALDRAARHRAAPRLGAFLRALHGLPVPDDAPPDTMRRADLPYRAGQLHERLDTLADRLDPAQLAAARHATDALSAVPAPDRPPCWMHGDLYARHVIVDAEHDVVGIIDWGDLHAGERSKDLSIAYSLLPAAARPAFFDAYGPVDAATRDRARFAALFYAAALRLYADDIGDTALSAESEHTFANALG